MKAAVVEAPQKLVITDVPDPICQPDEVMLRVFRVIHLQCDRPYISGRGRFRKMLLRHIRTSSVTSVPGNCGNWQGT